MSIIGAVSLTNNTGLFLGEVNLNNLNLASNQLVYSSDGVNMSGLNIGDGLQKNIDTLITIGNSNIQLTSNSLYVNDNVQTIQSKIDIASQADVIYVSSGSYGESQITFTDKYNLALVCPDVGNTITEVLNGILIKGTSEMIRIANLQIEGGSASVISGVGRYYFKNCVFQGSLSQTHFIAIGQSTTQYMTFMNCEFDQYCTITIPSTLGAPIYFINCNFGGATIAYNNVNQLLVIMSNCAGLLAYPASNKATLVGLNALTSGASQVSTNNVQTTLFNGSIPLSVSSQSNKLIPFCTATGQSLTCDADFNFTSSTNTLAVPNLTVTNINGSSYPPASSGVSVLVQGEGQIPYCTANSNELTSDVNLMWFPSTKLLSTNIGEIDCEKISFLKYIKLADGTESQNNTNKVLTSDGENGFKFEENGGAYSIICNNFLSGQQTAKSGNSINLFDNSITPFYNKFPDFPTIYTCIFNFSISGTTTLTLQINDGFNTSVYTQSLQRTGHHQISAEFLLPANGSYDYAFIISASGSSTISTDTLDYYSIKVQQVKGTLPLA
jgi:hypothetical protein